MSEIAIENTATERADAISEWSFARRVTLRFVWAYVILYFFPRSLDMFVPFVVTPFSGYLHKNTMVVHSGRPKERMPLVKRWNCRLKSPSALRYAR